VFTQIDVTGRRLDCRVIHRAGDDAGGPLSPDAPRMLLAGQVP
jgi:hypothetical protein